MERINVRVDQRLKQELEAEAREKGVSPSDIAAKICSKDGVGSRISGNMIG